MPRLGRDHTTEATGGWSDRCCKTQTQTPWIVLTLSEVVGWRESFFGRTAVLLAVLLLAKFVCSPFRSISCQELPRSMVEDKRRRGTGWRYEFCPRNFFDSDLAGSI